jgi:hypothetical protein
MKNILKNPREQLFNVAFLFMKFISAGIFLLILMSIIGLIMDILGTDYSHFISV